ncbi:ABC transporter permease subunit [Undibacterium arcticum]
MMLPLSWVPEPIGSGAAQFADGARVTVALTAISGVIGILLGVFRSAGEIVQISAAALGRQFFYVWAIRGTPLLVQVLFVFLALPSLVPGLQLSDFNSAVVALAFNAGAYNAEAIRAGILAINKGQTEAARSLGLTPFMTFRDVIFFRRVFASHCRRWSTISFPC